MRIFIVRQFALYGRIKANIAMFSGMFAWLCSLVMLLAGSGVGDDGDTAALLVLFGCGCILFASGLSFIPKKTYIALRCGTRIFLTAVALGISLIFDRQQSDTSFSFVTMVLMALFAATLYFGFVYFRFYPVEWDELDQEQKYDYGAHAMSGDGHGMTVEQHNEWLTIAKQYE